jgi:DNA-binding XRE family transcriptional regulator
MTAFALLVRRSRQAAWMTQEELAERSGLSPRTIQAIERGEVRRPHRESVRLLADALRLHGEVRAEFEATARQGSPTAAGRSGVCGTHSCPACADLSGCLVRRLRDAVGRVDLDGLGPVADPVAVLVRLLRAAGVELEDSLEGYGLTGSVLPNHTLPAQMLPGA